MRGFATFLAGIALAATAGAVTFPRPPGSVIYDCRVDASHGHGWVSPRLLFAYSAGPRQLQVMNAEVLHRVGHPIPGEVRTDSDGRTVFHWTLQAVDSWSRHVTVIYDATLAKDGQTLNVRDLVEGFSNLDEAHGACALK